MSLRSGLRSGLVSGLESGLDPSWGADRAWPTSAAEHTAAYPGIVAPTAIYSAQDSSGPALDGVGSVDLSVVSAPVFGVTGEAGRLGIEFDTNLDQIIASSAASFDPDGATDMSYMLRAYLPSYVDAAAAIMGKRGGTGFAGFEMWLNSSNEIAIVQDGGASGRQDFAHTGFASGGGWADILYVIDRTAGVGRVETSGGTTTKTLSGITSLSSTIAFSFGKNNGAGRNALNGMILGYGRVWDGTALTRAEFLTLTT